MKAQGKPAALIAITATLTLALAGHAAASLHKKSFPQVRPQVVDAASTVSQDSIVDEMRLIRSSQRASRSRPVVSAKPTVAPQHKVTKFLSSPKAVVKAVPRSTWTPKPRIVRKEQSSVSRGTSAYAWAHSRSAYRVSNCESGDRSAPDVNTRYNGNPHLRDGYYHGKWQMDADFWATYGGKQYASDAADASESEQDIVAYHGYQARGWEPWSCSSIMGVN